MTARQFEITILVSDPETNEVVQRTIYADQRLLSDSDAQLPNTNMQEVNFRSRVGTAALGAIQDIHRQRRVRPAPVGGQITPYQGHLRPICSIHPNSPSKLYRDGFDANGNQKWKKQCVTCLSERNAARYKNKDSDSATA